MAHQFRENMCSTFDRYYFILCTRYRIVKFKLHFTPFNTTEITFNNNKCRFTSFCVVLIGNGVFSASKATILNLDVIYIIYIGCLFLNVVVNDNPWKPYQTVLSAHSDYCFIWGKKGWNLFLFYSRHLPIEAKIVAYMKCYFRDQYTLWDPDPM